MQLAQHPQTPSGREMSYATIRFFTSCDGPAPTDITGDQREVCGSTDKAGKRCGVGTRRPSHRWSGGNNENGGT